MPALEINIIIKFIKIKDLKIQGVRKLSKGINIRMQRRSLVVLIVLVFIGFPVLIFRLVNLQIIKRGSFKLPALFLLSLDIFSKY